MKLVDYFKPWKKKGLLQRLNVLRQESIYELGKPGKVLSATSNRLLQLALDSREYFWAWKTEQCFICNNQPSIYNWHLILASLITPGLTTERHGRYPISIYSFLFVWGYFAAAGSSQVDFFRFYLQVRISIDPCSFSTCLNFLCATWRKQLAANVMHCMLLNWFVKKFIATW